MEISIANTKNKTVELAESVFACQFNEPLVHQIVTAFLAGKRAGTHAQKTRAQVQGGGAKPWRQKGTGRARAGTIRSPLWRKGGVIFAATPRSYKQKVNKKMYKGALRAIFSEAIRLNKLVTVEDFKLTTHKTKDFLAELKKMQLSGRVLLITQAVEPNLYLASRNLHLADVRDVISLDPVCLIHAEKIIITVPALKQVEAWLT